MKRISISTVFAVIISFTVFFCILKASDAQSSTSGFCTYDSHCNDFDPCTSDVCKLDNNYSTYCVNEPIPGCSPAPYLSPSPAPSCSSMTLPKTVAGGASKILQECKTLLSGKANNIKVSFGKTPNNKIVCYFCAPVEF